MLGFGPERFRGFAAAAADAHGRGVAGDGPRRDGLAGVQHEEEGGDEECLAAARDDFAQLAVEFREKGAGIGGTRGAVAHQGAEDRGDEGRARAVAHHIGDEDGDAVFIQFDEIEEVATDGRGRLIEMGELEAQRVMAGVGGGGRIVRGEQRELEFAGQVEVLAHGGGFGGDFGFEFVVVVEDARGDHREIPGERFDLVAGADGFDRIEAGLRLLALEVDLVRVVVGRRVEAGGQGDRAGGAAESGERLQDVVVDEAET